MARWWKSDKTTGFGEAYCFRRWLWYFGVPKIPNKSHSVRWFSHISPYCLIASSIYRDPTFSWGFSRKTVDFNVEQIRCLGAASPWGWTRICVARHPWGLPLMLDGTPGHGGFWRFLEVSGWENRRTNWFSSHVTEDPEGKSSWWESGRFDWRLDAGFKLLMSERMWNHPNRKPGWPAYLMWEAGLPLSFVLLFVNLKLKENKMFRNLMEPRNI
jgi:hypothetical protein